MNTKSEIFARENGAKGEVAKMQETILAKAEQTRDEFRDRLIMQKEINEDMHQKIKSVANRLI
jgi:hypothetical protein